MRWQTLLPLMCFAGVAHADTLPRNELRVIAVNTLVATVQFDVPTAERVQTIADKYYDAILSERIESTSAMHELRLVLRHPHPDDRRVRKLTDAVIAHRTQLRKLQEERMHDMSRVLSPSQFGHLLSSWRAVERNIRKEARRS